MFYQKAVARKRSPTDSSKDGGSGTGSGEDSSSPYESNGLECREATGKHGHRDAIIEELALQGANGTTPEDRLLAAAIAPFKVCSRLTTPTRPLTPAYQPSQPVTVSSVRIVTGNGGEITLPPGYVTYTRDTKNTR